MTFLRTVTEDEIKQEKAALTHISLFTGCGGMDLGMCMAGFESRVMIEISNMCCETLRANWFWEELKKRKNIKMIKGKVVETCPLWKSKKDMKKTMNNYHDREPVILQEDITTLSTQRILEAADLKVGEATVVTGGPPCQGFSTIGQRVLEDPRNKLFKEFVRVVGEALPKMFIFENVPGLVSIGKGEVIKQICEEFANVGYNIKWDILNAADFGVPQNRRRVIMFGRRIDVMRFPETGNFQLHMGAVPGKIDHPDFYRKKHDLVGRNQHTLKDFKELDTLMELFKQMNTNGFV